MNLHYLEFVTPDVDATCAALEAVHGVPFSPPDDWLGAARTAVLSSGGMLGVRAPMHETEEPVARCYLLVEDIQAAVAAAESAGATIMLPPMQIPGAGTCAIYAQGGNQFGLWQA